jgi:uncharacterized membrane protein YgdD (TMEM256/DUF423 family)
MKIWITLASLLGMLSVLAGAFGAHALKSVLTADQLASWETAVRYQLAHALALLMVGLLMQQGWSLRPTAILFLVGTLLFSGSIYLLCFKLGPGALLGPLTPIGGVMLIAGWGWMAWTAIRIS